MKINTKFIQIANLYLTHLVYYLQVTIGKVCVMMVCQFCYDRPVVKATGHDGQMIGMSCPMCGIEVIPNFETTVNNTQSRRKSDAGVSANKIKPGLAT